MSVGGPGRPRRRILALALAVLVLALASCRDGRARAAAEGSGVPVPSETLLETRRYRFGVDDRAPLLSGWSGQHEWSSRTKRHFVWATAEEARFELTILRVEDKQGIVALRTAPTKEPQEVEVRVNGLEVARLHPITHFREYRIEIPAETLRIGRNELSFRHSSLRASRDPRRDPRRFAVAYSEILLGPECLPLRPKGPPEPPGVVSEPDGSWTITGPAALDWSRPPSGGASVRARLALGDEGEAAEATLSLRHGEAWLDLDSIELTPSWIGRTSEATIEGVIPEASEPTTIRLLVQPPSCTTLRTTVRLDELAIRSAEESLQSESAR
jgi:hypothetical protein